MMLERRALSLHYPGVPHAPRGEHSGYWGSTRHSPSREPVSDPRAGAASFAAHGSRHRLLVSWDEPAGQDRTQTAVRDLVRSLRKAADDNIKLSLTCISVAEYDFVGLDRGPIRHQQPQFVKATTQCQPHFQLQVRGAGN